MTALAITDLDHYAKHAVQVVAGRANEYTAARQMSVGQIAADMGVDYATARRALNRAVAAEYLTTDKRKGALPKWELAWKLLGLNVNGSETTSRGLRDVGNNLARGARGSEPQPRAPGATLAERVEEVGRLFGPEFTSTSRGEREDLARPARYQDPLELKTNARARTREDARPSPPEPDEPETPVVKSRGGRRRATAETVAADASRLGSAFARKLAGESVQRPRRPNWKGNSADGKGGKEDG